MNEEKQIITLKDSPYYFGAYLNNARHNVFLIANHIATKFGYKVIEDDADIPGCFLTNKIVKKPNQTFTHLVRSLHVCKVFDPERLPKSERKSEDGIQLLELGKDFESMAKYLRLCFKELNAFRNDYTHYYSTISENTKKVKIDLELSSFLISLFERAIYYTKERYENVFEENDFTHLNEYKLFEDNDIFNQNGLVFFTCLFLDRESAFHFINRISGYKATHEAKFRVTREVLTCYCISLPNERFISEDPKQAFALDILNELNKCPKLLFDVLNEDTKEQFQPKMSDDAKAAVEKNTEFSDDNEFENFDDYIRSITKRIRFSDRFPYFALKYLDDSNSFSRIRFQINLGKYQIDEYEKEFNGTFIPRFVVEEAKAFGKLTDFINNQDDVESKINKIDSEKSYFEQWSPHYHISNNKIAIFVSPKNESRPEYPILLNSNGEGKVAFNLKLKLPTAFISIHELSKVILLEQLNPGVAESLILAFIQTNNDKIFNKEFVDNIKSQLVFSKVFNRRNQTRKPDAYNDMSLKILLERKEKLNHILIEHGLDVKQIPSRIVDYWLDIENISDEKGIAERIKEMKRDCVSRLKAKTKGKAPKIGEMATFLAKDIVDMIIGEEKKKKITSFYYDQMQECLALYADPDKKKTFNLICNQELNLIHSEDGHPFLKKIDFSKITKTHEFYEAYLLEKGGKVQIVEKWVKGRYGKPDQKKSVKKHISWMYLTFYKIEFDEIKNKNLTKVVFPKQTHQLPLKFSKMLKEKAKFDVWLNNVKHVSQSNNSKPIDLPTNIFDSVIAEKLSALLNREKNSDERYNHLFIEWNGAHNIQKYYLDERVYDIYSKTISIIPGDKIGYKAYFVDIMNQVFKEKSDERTKQNEKNRTNLPPIELSDIQRVFYKVIRSTEVGLRKQIENDRLMLLMSSNLMTDDIKLDLQLNNLETVLNETVDIEQIIHCKTIFDRRKRKDFTVFKYLVNDRRLINLLEYFKDEKIAFAIIKTEISAYTSVKEQLFNLIYLLEERLLSAYKDEILDLFIDDKGSKMEGNVKHSAYINWLFKNGKINEVQNEFMVEVRNKFSHNQFPSIEVTKKLINFSNKNSFSTQIYDAYFEIAKNILTLS